MTLLEIIYRLEEFPGDQLIYADRDGGHWTADSPAVVARVDTICSVTDDGRMTQRVGGRTRECLLSIAAARKAVEVFKVWSGNSEPSADEKLKAVLYYAAHASYLPAGNYYNEEHAELFDLGVQWDIGAPLPVLIANEDRTFLVFYLRNVDPDWDGTYVHVRDPAQDIDQPMAVLEFRGCHSAKLGDPNDEVLHGHRLWGRGLKPYGAFLVRNSTWVAELRRINEVHESYRDPKVLRGESYFTLPPWERMNHYLFALHDSTFECVAESFTVSTFSSSMPEVLQAVLRDLFTG
jgi:hypothetical protein